MNKHRHKDLDQHMRGAINVVYLAVSFLLSVGTALGQATFEMRNRNTISGVDAPIFDALGVPLVGTNYVAELWGGAKADSLTPTVDYDFGGRLIVPFGTGGYFSTFHAASVSAVPGGFSAWLQVRSWDARLGGTYEDVVALNLGGYGASPVFFALGGNPGPLVPPAPLIGLQSFSLLEVIPEPNATWLLLLGLPFLWMRARKSK